MKPTKVINAESASIRNRASVNKQLKVLKLVPGVYAA